MAFIEDKASVQSRNARSAAKDEAAAKAAARAAVVAEAEHSRLLWPFAFMSDEFELPWAHEARWLWAFVRKLRKEQPDIELLRLGDARHDCASEHCRVGEYMPNVFVCPRVGAIVHICKLDEECPMVSSSHSEQTCLISHRATRELTYDGSELMHTGTMKRITNAPTSHIMTRAPPPLPQFGPSQREAESAEMRSVVEETWKRLMTGPVRERVDQHRISIVLHNFETHTTAHVVRSDTNEPRAKKPRIASNRPVIVDLQGMFYTAESFREPVRCAVMGRQERGQRLAKTDYVSILHAEADAWWARLRPFMNAPSQAAASSSSSPATNSPCNMTYFFLSYLYIRDRMYDRAHQLDLVAMLPLTKELTEFGYAIARKQTHSVLFATALKQWSRSRK